MLKNVPNESAEVRNNRVHLRPVWKMPPNGFEQLPGCAHYCVMLNVLRNTF